MKKIIVFAFVLTLMIFTSGCSEEDEFDLKDSGLMIGGDIMYYKDYNISDRCDSFDVFVVYKTEESYFYAESYWSMEDVCSSGLYVLEEEKNVSIEYAYRNSLYSQSQFDDVQWGYTIYESSMSPPWVTLTTLKEELIHLDQLNIYNQARMIENAAKLYCAQNECTLTQGLTWADLSAYVVQLDVNDYDMNSNSGSIAVYSSGSWMIYLERSGVGEWEFTQGAVPSQVDGTGVILDLN